MKHMRFVCKKKYSSCLQYLSKHQYSGFLPPSGPMHPTYGTCMYIPPSLNEAYIDQSSSAEYIQTRENIEKSYLSRIVCENIPYKFSYFDNFWQGYGKIGHTSSYSKRKILSLNEHNNAKLPFWAFILVIISKW